jgi:IS4 transposase
MCGKTRTGAKKRAKGRPPLRANAQSWREAAASEAMQDAVKLMIRIDVMTLTAERLFVAFRKMEMMG